MGHLQSTSSGPQVQRWNSRSRRIGAASGGREPSGGERPVAVARQQIDASVENALIERVLAGDREAFYELIKPYERAIYLAAHSITQNPADAEEIAQEAALK